MLLPSLQESGSLKDIAVWAAILAIVAVIPLAIAFTLAFWLSGRLRAIYEAARPGKEKLIPNLSMEPTLYERGSSQR